MAVVRSGVSRDARPGAPGPGVAAARPRLDDRIGQVLGGRYRLLAPVGTGASAAVYLADDVTLRRRVAVKVLHPALADDEAFLRRFRAEAHAAAALNHPHVLAVYDWNGSDEVPFLVTEYLDGGSLRALLDSGARLSASQALLVGLETARGLDYAHRRGFVHRDIKPANLLFDDEARVRIADFGLARALAEATWTEPQGAVLGTARYASPEQARGEPLDGRSDVYSLAIVLIEAVTGLVPLAVDTTIGTLMARVDRDLPVPDGLGALTPVLEAAGRCQPRDRLDAAEFGAALLLAAEGMDRPEPLPLAGAMADPSVAAFDPDPTEVQSEPHAPATAAAPADEPGRRRRRRDRRAARRAAEAAAAGAAAHGTAIAGTGLPLRDGGPEPVWAPEVPSGPVAVVAPGAASPHGGPVLYDVDLDSDLGFGTGPHGVVDLREPIEDHADAAAADAADLRRLAPDAGAPDATVVEPSPSATGSSPVPDGQAATELGLDAVAAAGATVVAPGVGDEPASRRERKAARRAAAEQTKAAEAAAKQQRKADDAEAKARRTADRLAARAGRRRWPRIVGVLVVLGLVAGAVGYWYVELRIPRYPVPDLTSRDLGTAQALAASNGWQLQTTDDRRDGTRPGEILSQSPSSGTDLERDATLSLVVSLGNTLVPVPTDLVGVTQEEAGRRLAASELVVGDVTTVNDEEIPAGTVMSLGAGVPAELPKGSGVGLVVSKGPVPRTIPDGLAGVPADNAVGPHQGAGPQPQSVAPVLRHRAGRPVHGDRPQGGGPGGEGLERDRVRVEGPEARRRAERGRPLGHRRRLGARGQRPLGGGHPGLAHPEGLRHQPAGGHHGPPRQRRHPRHRLTAGHRHARGRGRGLVHRRGGAKDTERGLARAWCDRFPDPPPGGASGRAADLTGRSSSLPG
ncbi:MAG: protein kinase [Acidimicrobiales bacterium]